MASFAKPWLAFRLALMALSFAAGAFEAISGEGKSFRPLLDPEFWSSALCLAGALLTLGPIFVALLLSCKPLFAKGALDWSEPSHADAPFNRSKPLAIFHFLAFMALANGAGALCMTPFGGAGAVLDGLLGVSTGCGLLLGMALARHMNAGRTEP